MYLCVCLLPLFRRCCSLSILSCLIFTFLYLLHLFFQKSLYHCNTIGLIKKFKKKTGRLGVVYKTRDDSFLQDPKFDCFKVDDDALS